MSDNPDISLLFMDNEVELLITPILVAIVTVSITVHVSTSLNAIQKKLISK